MLPKLTAKEWLIFSIAYYNKLNENGELKVSKMNSLRYKACCKIAGGKDKLDNVCLSIGRKFEEAGMEIEKPE